MRRDTDWIAVDETTPFERLEPGGYVVRITDAEDVERREYVYLVYDVAEGPRAGFYSDDFGRRNPWAHRFARSYKDSAKGMFKAFLSRLEESNRGFSIEQWQRRSDPRDFVGLELGVVLQFEDYTNDRGEDKERLEVVSVLAAQDVRNGDFTVPARRDNRTGVQAGGAPQAGGVPQAAFGERVPAAVYDDGPLPWEA